MSEIKNELKIKFGITDEQIESVKAIFLKNKPMAQFPAREKKKVMLLFGIAEAFELNKDYTEGQVNAMLSEYAVDFVALRRYLVDYKLLGRTTDGSRYWRND